MTDLTAEKKQLRSEIVAKRAHLTKEEKQLADASIAQRLFALSEVQSATVICIYISLPEEVDTREVMQKLLADGKTIVAPKVISKSEVRLHRIASLDDVVAGFKGILEPIESSPFVSAETVEVFVVPGVVFDRQKNRVGRGGGHYDRLLQGVTVSRIGFAYDCQVVAEVSSTSYDVPMTSVITEKEII